MDVLVTGASGRLGPRLLTALQQGDGGRVRAMSRRGAGPGGVRGDLATGFDLPLALRGAQVVVHAASDPRNAWEVDVAGTRRLVQAVDRERLQHLVYVSIVGVDRIPYGYYRAKYATEQVLRASGLPITIVRITQFHPFVDELLGSARRGPVLPVPMGWRTQPVDIGDAAEFLARVARQDPTGDIVEFGGPEELSAADLARSWSAARESGAHVVATPVPGRLSTAFRDGAALPSDGGRGHRTFAAYLRG